MVEDRGAGPAAIAILSTACRYPDANSREDLWSNVLAGRRAFRAVPVERLDLTQYDASVVGEADSITGIRAGLLADWQFDCARYRIPKATFDTADLSHWLALDVAAEAITQAGGEGILCARDATAVIVANTLTGEFSRAATLRLRAPFLDELLAQALREANLDETASIELRRRFVTALRGRFPAPQEDSLSGALANTIAGRIANHFDLHGGAYSVDAACASSLVAIANAADLLLRGAADAVVVGAVDLSLDPFELVGFSRNGALAADDMRVFDARSSGFWPGEGAAFAVLMREDMARARKLPVLAVLRGWGISTDGAGGFTRPAVSGQSLALRRAYEHSGVDPMDVGYVEAHGTGTATGDPVEVRALAALRAGAAGSLPIGSIKANIGHAKAAAGFAGLIKTISALENGIVPPHVSCTTPHPVFREVDDCVRPALAAEAWRDIGARVAGISSFGFGGVNAHLVIEAAGRSSRAAVLPPALRTQDAELFVFAADDAASLLAQMASLRARAASLTLAEFADAAAHFALKPPRGLLRVALIAPDPETLAAKLATAARAIETTAEMMNPDEGILVARGAGAKIGFLFPGQASAPRPRGGAWARRFHDTGELLPRMPVESEDDSVDTRTAQPLIAAVSLTALRILRACKIEAEGACGHSLGELTALAWAGALSERELVALAAARGAAMSVHGRPGGAMLRIAADPAAADRLVMGLGLAIACHNGPTEVVVSGRVADIDRAALRASKAGIETTRLATSHAFHSRMMEPASAAFAAALRGFNLGRPRRPVWSTIAGRRLVPTDDVEALLIRQLTAPVLFEEALRGLAAQSDLLIEVGPGSGLSRLTGRTGLRAISVDAFGESLAPLLAAIGVVFVSGRAVEFAPLFEDRNNRPITIDARPRLLASPCGRRDEASTPIAVNDATPPVLVPAAAPASRLNDVLAVVRATVAEETGFAPDNIRDDDRFLDDLHLSSIAVARIVTKACGLIGIASPNAPTEFAYGTAGELADGLIALRDLGPPLPSEQRIAGVRRWVRTFEVRWTPRPPGTRKGRSIRWRTVVVHGTPDDVQGAARLDSGGNADGLLIWIGAGVDEQATFAIFDACRAAWRDQSIAHLAICHVKAPISAFARSLALERRFQSVIVIERQQEDETLEAVAVELASGLDDGFREVRIADDGARLEPYLALAAVASRPADAVTTCDVVLVTGGAKGIGAECALRLASRSGAGLILVGRSPADDATVVATLERARANGIHCHYAAADVADAGALAAAVAAEARELGPVTVLIHAAGANEPRLFRDVDDAALASMLAPKTSGFRAAVDAAGTRLRRIIAFGSILGRIGLEGESHYAIANAWQSAIATEIALARRDYSVLSIEWSVWNAAGMGQRLGSLERLAAHGVAAIELDDGVGAFERLVQCGATGAVVVTSRFGPPRHFSMGSDELPTLRFIDIVRLHYPGLELVIETELSLGRDPSLADHRIDGHVVVPAVIGLEAMAQVACALLGRRSPSEIEASAFHRAIIVPDDGTLRIQILALAGEHDRVEVAIRTQDDGFATDSMRAAFIFGRRASEDREQAPSHFDTAAPIDAQPLYGPLLFQGDAFRRLDAYSRLSARRIAASLRASDGRAWFGAFESQELMLGDPGGRDALLHCLQAAVPHRRVVPVSVKRILFGSGEASVRIVAFERDATADAFEFDILAYDANDRVAESWQGVTFRAVAPIAGESIIQLVPQLAVAYLERVARAVLSEPSIEVVVVNDGGLQPEERRRRALALLDLDGRVFDRADGRPLIVGDGHACVSIAHCEHMTLAVRADRDVGCDIEFVHNAAPDSLGQAGTPLWSLTAELAASGDESLDIAATRAWTFYETAVKQAHPFELRCKVQRSARGEITTLETAFGRTTTVLLPGGAHGVVAAIGVTHTENTRLEPLTAAKGPSFAGAV